MGPSRPSAISSRRTDRRHRALGDRTQRL